jgi:redox-sensitive bicupin YhaK (pirin superfamily)
MSNLERNPQETVCGGRAVVATSPMREVLPGRDVPLGRTTVVRRFLPHRDRRMVGAWCLVDHYGPDDVSGAPGMRVPPHPHTGLQTVSWLVEGEILHRDSLGSLQAVRPGELNLMTSGRGISHSEESPADHPPTLHGVQLWVALPDGARDIGPDFKHHATLPVLQDTGLELTVLVGEVAGSRSPAVTHTPLLGAEIALRSGADARVPVEPDFEHAAIVLSGAAVVDGMALEPGTMVYLGCGRSDVAVRASSNARVLLIGGEPFAEQLVMWWNFIGRSHEEIVAMREDWMTGDRFGVVRGYDGDPLPAPPLPNARLKPRGRGT